MKQSPINYIDKLNKFGIEVGPEEVINSNYLVARYLKSNLTKNDSVMVIGEAPLCDELINYGIPITQNSEEARYVILGWDREFTYEKLNRAFQAWRNDAQIIATNPDRTCPVEAGQVPDCGAMLYCRGSFGDGHKNGR